MNTAATCLPPRSTLSSPQDNVVSRWPGAIDVDESTIQRMLAELLHRHERRSEESFHLQLDALQSVVMTLHSMALTDDLTHLYNRRGFLHAGARRLAALTEEMRRALLLFIDVDNLKAVNDSLGHAAGDDLLIRTAQVLRDSSGHGDVIGRLGGDEFAAVLPLADARSGPSRLARLRDAIAACNSPHPSAKLSLTIGVTEFDPRNPLSVAKLLHLADQAMYTGKLGVTQRRGATRA